MAMKWDPFWRGPDEFKRQKMEGLGPNNSGRKLKAESKGEMGGGPWEGWARPLIHPSEKEGHEGPVLITQSVQSIVRRDWKCKSRGVGTRFK